MPPRWTLDLLPDVTAVSAARRFVAECCLNAGLTTEACDIAMLLASETVTNAFVHGRSDARIAVEIIPGGVMIEVADDNPHHPQLVAYDVHATAGRGIRIVTLLATRWGVRQEIVGKTVWFHVHGG